MATVEDLFAALRAADQAGNAEDATKIAKVLSGLGYGPKIEEAAAPPAEPGFFQRAKTALGRGLEQVPESLSGIALGAQSGLGMREATERKLQEIQAAQAKPTEGAPAITYEELEKTYGKEGALAVLKKLPTYVTEQILQSAPSMAVPLAVGAAATPFTSPIGGLVAGIGTYGAQQFGQFMQRQAAGAKTAEELEPGKAALAAGVTAPLGFFVDRLTLGMSKVPTKALGEGIVAELAKRSGASVAGRAATGATIGIIAEAPTEMLEQMAERWQANLPLFNEEAVREYKEAAAGAAAVGGGLGATSRVLAGRPQEVQAPAPELPAQAPQAPTLPEIPAITPAAQVPPQVEQVPPQVEQVPPQVEQVPPAPAFAAPLGGEIREMPGFAGPANANQQLMAIARQRQAQAEAQAARDAADYQRKVRAIEGQSFSSDPLADRLAKDRMIASLPQPQVQPQVPPVTPLPAPPAELNYFERQDAIRRAEQADVQKGMRKRRERDTRFAPEELEQMGIPIEKKKAEPQFKATEHPENIGLTGFDAAGEPIIELLSAGAKPFKSRKAADMAKAYRNDMKVVRLPTGEYVLSPKTEAELKREQDAAKRLGAFQPGQAKGLPEAAHEYIISKGGFAPSEKSALGLTGPNVRVGNKYLFNPQGMTIAKAAEALREAGYIETEEENAVIDAMEKTFKLNQRIYTPEGYERIAEIEQNELNQQYQKKAEQEALYTPEADVYDYMHSDDFYRQPMEEVRRLAEAHGVDAEAIFDELARRIPDATQEQYEDAAKDSIAAAIRAQQGLEPRSIQEVLPTKEAEFTGYNATKEGLAIQKQIEGKSINQVADWLVANAPSAFQRLSAQKTRDMIRALQNQGVEMTFEVYGGRDRISSLYEARGITGFQFTPSQTTVNVKLNGEPVIKNQNGYPSGMNYGTLLHELMHVATRPATRFLPMDHPLRKDLRELFNKVVIQYNADFKAGKLPPVLQKFSRNMNNVLSNPDELITWGFQDKEFQQYLDSINVGPKQTAFNKLVSLIRDILGFAKPFETALERLVRTTDSILSIDAGVLGNFVQDYGYSFGNRKAAAMLTQQDTLFSSQKLLRDTLESRAAGFYFDAKQSPLYQTRTAKEVGDFSQQEADKIVSLEGRAKKIQEERRWVGKLKDGAWVGTRLDLAVFRVAKKAGLPPVLAVHEGSESKHIKGGFSKGELLRLVPHITLRNVRFNVMQGERERIAEGGEKGRMASADGQYMDVPPNFDGIEVSFNPTREHLFRDALGRAVKYADEVTVLKNRMYARGNIEYFGAEDVPPVPTQPSDSWIMGSGQDARQLQERPAIIDDAGKVSKEQQKNLFDGQDIVQDSLFSRETGFFIDAKQSPLYQTRTAQDVPVITQELANRALATHAKGARVEGKGIELKPGDYIGARLDLPIRASSRGIMDGGVPLQAIHMGNASNYAREDGGFYGGKIAKYLPSVTMKNVKFRINQAEREEIAAGRKKAPMGSADGQFVRSDNPNFDGIELRFNPKREHLFIDAMGRAVKYADEVTVMGDRMYARGHVEYFGDEDFIQPKGVSPTQARVLSVEEALRQAGPAVERAVIESANTGKPLPPTIQESLFSQQGMSRRGFFGLRPASEAAAPAAPSALEKLMQVPVSRRAVLKTATAPLIKRLIPNVAAEFLNPPNNFARVAKTSDGYFFIEQPDGTWEGRSLGSFENLRDLIEDFATDDGINLSFGALPSKMIEDGEIISDLYQSANEYLGPTQAEKAFHLQQYGEALPGSTKTLDDLLNEVKEYERLAGMSPEQRAKTERDKAFKSWFGNSKVVDAEGKPLVVYHGTIADVDKFIPSERFGEMYFASESKDYANAMAANIQTKGEGGNVMPLYVSLQNPRIIKHKDLSVDQLNKALTDNNDGLISVDDDGVKQVIVAFKPNQLKSAIGNRGTFSPFLYDVSMEREAMPTRTQTGSDAMEILSGIGRFVEPPEPGYADRVRESWRNARDNPGVAKDQALGAFRRWTDQVQTWAFSSDAALNNQIRRAIMDSSLGNEEKIGTLLNASLSQTVHSDAVANLFLMEGNIKWDEELHKWTGVKDENNIVNLSGFLDKLADRNGLTKEEAELIAHTAFEARRTASLIRENEQIDAQVAAIRAEAARIRSRSPVGASELSDRAQRLQERKKIIHMTPEQIEAGMVQFRLFPELTEVADTWNGIRENALKVMVDTGLYSRQEAEDLLSNADYVPFFREDQIEEGKGPKEFLRSLSVQADQRMRGSMKPVNDIFDNMVRWTQYAVNRGVRNRSALALVDTAAGLDLAERVRGARDGENVVRVWRDGKEEFYDMADPMFVSAFRGLESVAIPTVKYFSKIADWLRQSVVLYPGFAIAQVPQDAFAAMFTSGLKPQYALRIPVLAVKEFVQTLRGKSSLHEELKNVGAVGVRDFTSSVIRNDAEVLAGLKKDKSIWDGVKRKLGNLAMAADNSIRQATYEASLQQGLSRAEAIEKSFEIFNVRRRGNSKILAMAGQVIPFFNAYLAAQNVAYKTLTGAGTSPTQRDAALKTLAATTGSVFVLSLIYAMMNGDDEDYLKKPTPTRDRLLMIPGTGASLPLRADLFILPKVIAEHTYMMITDKGFSDAAKFRESIKSILANGLFSPTPVPQAIKPLSELILNYDFFQQKPLVGVFQQQKELGRQFEDSTSELSKLMGKTGYVSPIMADHFIRGMFGSVGGLALYMTNPILAAMAGTTRPEVTMRDALATVPNASAFVTKEYDVGLRKDFYALKEVTDRVASTVADMKNRSPQEIREYLEDPKVKQRLAMAPGINQIATRLTEIRKQVNLITNLEDPRYTSADKEQAIKQLREKEYQLLKNIDLKKLREMAQM